MEYSNSDFDIKKLGSFYFTDKTIFRVFAPETEKMYLVINNHQYEMHKNGLCFEIGLAGDLEKVKYNYLNDTGISFRDPFAYYSDQTYSYVLDTNKFINKTVTLNPFKDIIIYETSVRDFSSANSFTGPFKRKFFGLSQAGLKLNGEYSIGLDYLKELGITHLQLMPVLDFDLDGGDYNWGYNPLAYNYVNKDYVDDYLNPYAYINELRSVVNILHTNNIRVSLDVVFNHVYKYFNYDLEKMIPGHVFRYMENGELAKGSLCGNEIKSEDPFIREYLKEMCERYIRLFDIDGLRMDLMGILDYQTINQINDRCKLLKKDFIVYGEGWNMGDSLNEEYRATIINADKMPDIAMFNDFFRDETIKYISGNDSIKQEIKDALKGCGNNLKYNQSINYVECHDNNTFYDRMLRFKKDDPEWVNIRRSKLALALVMVSRGIPFIHSGQEFLRTKNLIENSYNASDDINKLDWNLRVKNNDVVEYFKGLVDIRKNNPEFINLDTNISFEDYYECLIYRLDNLMIIINPCVWDHTYVDSNTYEVIYDLNGKTSYFSDKLSIPAYSMLICKR